MFILTHPVNFPRYNVVKSSVHSSITEPTKWTLFVFTNKKEEKIDCCALLNFGALDKVKTHHLTSSLICTKRGISLVRDIAVTIFIG